MPDAKRSLIGSLDNSGVPLLVVRLTLGGLFIWMAFAKVGHPLDFLKEIRLYYMLPESPGIFLNSIAIALPWIEVFAGAALVLGVFARGGAATIVIMLLVFIPAIFIRAMVIRATEGVSFFDIEFDCGCGSGVVIIWKKLLTNSGLFLLALYVLLSRSRRFCLEGWLDRRREKGDQCSERGRPLSDATENLCEACAETSAYPVGAPDAAR